MSTRPLRAAIAAIAATVLFVPTPAPALRAQAAAGIDAAFSPASAGGRSARREAADPSPSPAATVGRNEYYFGATGGGLWKTADGGVTWRPVSDGFFKSSSVGAVAVAESQPDVVYAGMGEVQLRGNVIQGDGVYKSTDAGRTWTHMGLARSMAISRIRVHPANPDIVYVAALGDPVRSEHGAGHLQVDRRRQDVGERALPQQPDRRGRSVDGSEEPRRALRRLLGGLPHAAFAVERRARQRALQDHRWRQDMDRADEEPGPAGTALGQGRRVGLGRRRQPGLRHHRSRRRRRVPVERCRRDLVARQRRSPAAAAGVLLHPHLRRPAGARHGLHPQHGHLSLDRRRQDADGDPRSARRQPRPLDRRAPIRRG